MKAKVELFGGPLDGEVITLNIASNRYPPSRIVVPLPDLPTLTKKEALKNPIVLKIKHCHYREGEKGYYYEKYR